MPVQLQTYHQFEKTLEGIEDEDDIRAAKNVTKEQDELINEDLRPEYGQKEEMDFDENNPTINIDMMPPLYKYGLEMYSYLYDSALPEDRETMEEEKEEAAEKESSDAESMTEMDIVNQLGSESDGSDHHRTSKFVLTVPLFYTYSYYRIKKRRSSCTRTPRSI